MTAPLVTWRLVVVESPFSGEVQRNERYARACLQDCIRRGDSPIASHLLLTQPGVLNDDIPGERQRGMEAGWAWMRVCDAVVVYTDLGMSNGMVEGIKRAVALSKPVEYRKLEGWR